MAFQEEVDEPIPYAEAEVYLHTMSRGAQAGSLGAVLVATPLAIYKGYKGEALLRLLGRVSLGGFVAGAAFLVVGTKQKLDASDEWGIYDRAYRLRYNKGQVLWDKISYSSACAGLVLGSMVMNRGLWGGAIGFSSGLAMGIPLYVASKYVLPSLTTKEE